MEEMKPGREMDAELARKVMGCDVHKLEIPIGTAYMLAESGKEPKELYDQITVYSCQCSPIHVHNLKNGEIPEYSTDIAAAWEVVEKIKEVKVKEGKEESWMFTVTFEQDTKKWLAGYQYVYCDYSTNWINGAIAETPAHAICLSALAALKAVEK